MKLYSVSGTYTPKGCRKARGASGYVIAESKEEAIEKFKARLPASTRDRIKEYDYRAYEEEEGVSISHYF